MNIGMDSGTLAVGIGLLLFGVAYNRVVSWLEQRGYDEGYMGLIVAVGVGVTLAGVAILDTRAAALAFVAFALTGAPMVAGSVWRHARARERAQDVIRREALRR